jgi:hypothetical protein
LKKRGAIRTACQTLRTSLKTPDRRLRLDLTGLPLLVQIVDTGRQQGDTQHDYVVRLCCDNQHLFHQNTDMRQSYMVRLSPDHTAMGPNYHRALFDRLLSHIVCTAADVYEVGSRPYRDLCQNGAAALQVAFVDMSTVKGRIIDLQKGRIAPPDSYYTARRRGRAPACA